MHWTEDGWDDLNDDDESEPCPACGGSDDSGHLGDCPNNPYGINYRETRKRTQINAINQKQDYVINLTEQNCERAINLSAQSNDEDRFIFLCWLDCQVLAIHRQIEEEQNKLAMHGD